MNNMESNDVQNEEPTLISDDKQNENNAPSEHAIGSTTKIEPLAPEKIRWFYRSDSKKWIKFDGFDSLNIEYRYRANCYNDEELSYLNGSVNYYLGVHTVVVRGGLYEVDLYEKKCTSIFWPGK